MKKKHFRGKVKDDEIILKDPEKYFNFIKTLNGEEIFINIGKWYNKRSNRQNAYYWCVVIDILQNEAGYDDPEEVHKSMKRKHLQKKVVFEEEVEKSSTKLTTVEFEEYMKKIRMWASRDQNIYIPEPNEAPGGYAYELNKLPL